MTFTEAVMPAHAAIEKKLVSPQLGSQLRKLFDRVAEFQQRNFPHQSLDSKLVGAQREIGELRNAPDDLSEWADVLIFFFGAADKKGLTPDQLIAAAHAKMDVNVLRRWDKPDADGVHHHIEGERSEGGGAKQSNEEIPKA